MIIRITATRISGAVHDFEQIDVWWSKYHEHEKLKRVWSAVRLR